MELKGSKAYVTGGSRGIGRAIVLELARCGADVAFAHKGDGGKAREVVREVEGLGHGCVAFDSQVADSAEVARCVAEAVRKLGGLDILVNNAGITADAVLWKMTDDQWDQVLVVNLKGCFNHIRAVAPLFKEKKRGRIVNIS
ncbi:MAG: SDR family NAD(P)-dependent oxidoreductase, partial [Elusimicrobia bacterium]|nr:SDR family NAD(P)-dependent oxidoreductase [Elusimicrobiota bacterium]